MDADELAELRSAIEERSAMRLPYSPRRVAVMLRLHLTPIAGSSAAVQADALVYDPTRSDVEQAHAIALGCALHLVRRYGLHSSADDVVRALFPDLAPVRARLNRTL